MKKLMKKVAGKINGGYIAAALLLCGAGSALAEGEAVFDLTQITAAQTAVSTGMKSMMTGAVPVVLGIMFAGLIFWGLFWIFGLLMKAANKSKAK